MKTTSKVLKFDVVRVSINSGRANSLGTATAATGQLVPSYSTGAKERTTVKPA